MSVNGASRRPPAGTVGRLARTTKAHSLRRCSAPDRGYRRSPYAAAKRSSLDGAALQCLLWNPAFFCIAAVRAFVSLRPIRGTGGSNLAPRRSSSNQHTAVLREGCTTIASKSWKAGSVSRSTEGSLRGSSFARRTGRHKTALARISRCIAGNRAGVRLGARPCGNSMGGGADGTTELASSVAEADTASRPDRGTFMRPSPRLPHDAARSPPS